MEIDGSKTVVYGLEILSPLLNPVLEVGESTVTWVGRKYDGVCIGFKKDGLRKLEEMAEKTYGVQPRKHLDKRQPPFRTVGE